MVIGLNTTNSRPVFHTIFADCRWRFSQEDQLRIFHGIYFFAQQYGIDEENLPVGHQER